MSQAPSGYSETVVAGPDGSYLATGVTSDGAYQVAVNVATLPAGIDPTPTTYAAATQVFEITAGTDWLFADFGFTETVAGSTVGSIGDFVFLDQNGNGSFDVGEEGLEGVTVSLFDGSSTLVASTATDQNGGYDFDGLVAGSYTVEVTDTANVLWGLNLSFGTNPTASISLSAAQDYDLADFGYAASGGVGAVGNLVWHDVNGDGDFDEGESGVEGVSLSLYLDVNSNGTIEPGVDNLLRTTETDTNGEYYFRSLPVPGDYLVTITDRGAVMEGLSKTVGLPDIDFNSQADPYDVPLTNVGRAPTLYTADFGFSASGPSYALSGIVFFDNDGDGTQDPPTELGLADNQVFLFRDLDGDGVLDPSDVLFGTTTTGAGGSYSFAGLPDGSDWIVAVDTGSTFLSGAVQTTQLATSAVEPVSIAGANRSNVDFGFSKPPTQVLLTRFETFDAGGVVQVEWETSGEYGTLGFDLYRGEGNDWVLVNQDLIPAPSAAHAGAAYRVIDSSAPVGVAVDYFLVELEIGSSKKDYGPFTRTAAASPAVLARQSVEVDERRMQQVEIDRAAQVRSERERHSLRPNGVESPSKSGLLTTEVEGVHFVSVRELSRILRFDVGMVRRHLDNSRLRLRDSQGEVSWWGGKAEGGMFFYAQSPIDLLEKNEYVVDVETGSRARLVSPSTSGASPAHPLASVRAESDVFAATAASKDPESDFWFWSGLRAGDPNFGTRSFGISLNGVFAGSFDARLDVGVFAATQSIADHDHELSIRVNGAAVGSLAFDGAGRHDLELIVPGAMLQNGNNTVELTAVPLPGVPNSILYLDAIAIEYLHTESVDDDSIHFRSSNQGRVSLRDFSSPAVQVIDVSDPRHPKVVAADIQSAGATFSASFTADAAAKRFPGPDHRSGHSGRRSCNPPDRSLQSRWWCQAHRDRAGASRRRRTGAGRPSQLGRTVFQACGARGGLRSLWARGSFDRTRYRTSWASHSRTGRSNLNTQCSSARELSTSRTTSVSAPI